MDLKISELKVSTRETNALGSDLCRSEFEKEKSPTFACNRSNSDSGANTDIASKLDVVSPHDLSRALGKSKSTHLHLDSPECVTSKPFDDCIMNTGPVYFPVNTLKNIFTSIHEVLVQIR